MSEAPSDNLAEVAHRLFASALEADYTVAPFLEVADGLLRWSTRWPPIEDPR